MSVVPRQRAKGTVYYVTFTWLKKTIWEPAGTDLREARRLELRRKRQVADGTYEPPAAKRTSTVAGYANAWLGKRTALGMPHKKASITKAGRRALAVPPKRVPRSKA